MSGLGPKDSSWTVTPEMEEAIKHANTEQIKEIFRAQAVSQGLATQEDSFHPEILTPTPLSANAKTRVRERTINGETYVLRGSTDAELDAAEMELFRTLVQAPQATQQEQPVQARAENGRFTSAEQQASDGAVEAYLRNRGINPEDLQEVAGRGFTTRWSDASNQFLAAHSEWQGGDENMRLVGEKLIEMGLEDSPSVESLERAYAALQRENALRENPTVALAHEIAGATSHEDIRALGRQALGLPASGFFSR